MADDREDRMRELQERINGLREDWASLDQKKTWAIFLGVAGVCVIVGNIYGSLGSTNETLGVIGGGCVLGGILWYIDCRSKEARVSGSMRSAESALESLESRASEDG